MKNLTALVLMLGAFSLSAQKQQITDDFSVECPCALEVQKKDEARIYTCDMFATNTTYYVEVMGRGNVPEGITEKEFLQGYYRDLYEKALEPEVVSFRGLYAVQYQVTMPLGSRFILSDHIIFFFEGKRYTIIVTTVSGTRRTVFKDFTNTFEPK